jgi:hypothetical protein
MGHGAIGALPGSITRESAAVMETATVVLGLLLATIVIAGLIGAIVEYRQSRRKGLVAREAEAFAAAVAAGNFEAAELSIRWATALSQREKFGGGESNSARHDSPH